MFCHRCGTEVEDGSRFCPRCGAELLAESRAGAAAQQPAVFDQDAWQQARNAGFAPQARGAGFAPQTGTMGFAAAAPRENAGMGILGAVLFSLGGVAIWVILYRIGFVAAIAGIATLFLAVRGYTKLGHAEESRRTVAICIVISLVMMALAMYISAALEVWIAYKGSSYGPSLFDVFGYIPSLIAENSEFRGAFILDYVKGVLLSLIYGVIMFVQAKKKK